MIGDNPVADVAGAKAVGFSLGSQHPVALVKFSLHLAFYFGGGKPV